MQSNNPVFRRAEGFNGKAYDGYGDPSTWSTGAGQTTVATPTSPYTHQSDQGRMTVDSVVQKTGLTLGVVLVAAVITWIVTGNVVSQDAFGEDYVNSSLAGGLYAAILVGALGGFVLSLVNSFKRVVSPALVIAYAACEGLFIGGISKLYQLQFGPGVVTGAVVGTVAAFAGTLAAYKFFNIKVTDKFRRAVTAAMFGFVGLVVLDMVLGFFGSAIGFNGFGTLGLIMSVVGLVIAIFMLMLDFDFVERGVAAGLPERESWRAAFGLTVTLIWIYIQLLRLLAILSRR
ncbi:Bax inhibitor-1/YccA family protein [Nocardioides mangrovicus]|uniref:Bax inhibitor-1/YccA family protein n=1 Tax=Nocardioides mangrovicus TaxID=2478913 RepID=A0A3L8P648_9ACTN|nr:Bax inhibitor-1/YccA family protein [Nocardioides mangrovicus]RLV50725.1 Bax inhibitor-1/YccA family protein [Nocardioides mangrovicus]